YAAAYGVFISAAVASMFGDPVRDKLTLGGDGGGGFDLDSRGTVTLTVSRVTTAGPPATEVTDALAGRAPAAAVLGDLPASTRTPPRAPPRLRPPRRAGRPGPAGGTPAGCPPPPGRRPGPPSPAPPDPRPAAAAAAPGRGGPVHLDGCVGGRVW